jgi:hypothetical protein
MPITGEIHARSWRFLLIKLIIAAKLASSQRPLADKPEDGITDFSDEEEKDMCVILTLILLPTIGRTFPISDSVEYLFALQQIRRKCKSVKGSSSFFIIYRGGSQSIPSQRQATVCDGGYRVSWAC